MSTTAESAGIKLITEPSYYHRDYKNDFPKECENCSDNSWVNIAQRVAFTALPFVSLYKPLSFPLSLAMGALRTITSVTQLLEAFKDGNAKEISFAMLHTTVSVIALAGTIFAHPVGMLISTGHDLVIETIQLLDNLQKGDYQKAIENCLNIINNALYLALFMHGGLELTIASLAIQILVGLYHSQAEFKKGHFIEGTGHLLMSLVRGNQLASNANALRMRYNFLDGVKTCLTKANSMVGETSKSITNESLNGSTAISEAAISSAAHKSRFETYNVSIIPYDGHVFHVANYYDGTRVITTLDGQFRGYQGVYINETQINESFDVQWHSDYFVHRYPNGKVYSYSNKQVAELK